MSLSRYLAARSIAGCTHTAIAAGVNAVAGDKVQADEWSCVCFESLDECVDVLIVRLCRRIPRISTSLCVLCILTAQLLVRCAPLSLIFLNSPKSPSGESGSRHPRGESGSRHPRGESGSRHRVSQGHGTGVRTVTSVEFNVGT